MFLRPAALRAAATAAALALSAPALAQDAGSETPVDPFAVVATVNGTEITLGQIILMRSNLPAQFDRWSDDQLYAALVDQAVNQTLMAQRGREIGADAAPMAEIRRVVGERNYLAEAALRAAIREATSEEALRAAYEARHVGAEPVAEVRARHILVPEREAAEALKAEIEAGLAFEAAAAEHGTDGTSERGGDLGWFARDRMVEPFAEAAFAASEGEVVGPVETQFGWHLIEVTGRRDRPVPEFEAVRDELADELARAAAEAAVAEAREGAEIVLPETPPPASAIGREDALLGD